MNLFTVHLTTIAAFCHVLSIRRERIWSWETACLHSHGRHISCGACGCYHLVHYSGIIWLVFSRTLRSRKSIARASLFFMLTPRGSPSEELGERINIWLQRVIRFLGNYYPCVTVLVIKAAWLWQEPPPEENTWIFHNLTIHWINFFTPDMMMSIIYRFFGWLVFRESFTATFDTYPSGRLPRK